MSTKNSAREQRVIAIILAILIMLLMGLAGCQNNKNIKGDHTISEADTPAEDTNQEDKDTKELDPVELHWYFIGDGQQEDVELIEEKADEYLQNKLNTSIKLHCYDWGSYGDKMKTMVAAGEEFDICFTASWGLEYREQAARGAFVALDDLLDEYAPKTKELIGDAFLKGSEVDGKNYAIPANKEKAQQYGFLFLQEYVDKYNFDLSTIKKAEDIEPMLKVIKENEPGVHPLGGGFGMMLEEYFDNLGAPGPGTVRHDDEDFKVVIREEQPESKAYYELAHKFYNEGYIRKDAATVTDQSGDEKAGNIFCKECSLKPGKDKETSLATGRDWIQVAITPAIITNYDTMGSMQAISRTSKNPERALMFLELFNTDKYLNNLINFGIEDIHYEKVSDNMIKSGPDNEKYNPATSWMFGNVFLNYIWESEDPEKWEKFKEFNNSAIPAKTLGFCFDPTPVKNEIAACGAAGKDFDSGLTCGMLDPDEYLPKYMDALEDAGVEKIIEEKQRQLDAWIANERK